MMPNNGSSTIFRDMGPVFQSTGKEMYVLCQVPDQLPVCEAVLMGGIGPNTGDITGFRIDWLPKPKPKEIVDKFPNGSGLDKIDPNGFRALSAVSIPNPKLPKPKRGLKLPVPNWKREPKVLSSPKVPSPKVPKGNIGVESAADLIPNPGEKRSGL
jgi:hypothetical protein